MNLRALRTFVVSVDAGGLGRACSRLNISQPAASRQIRGLEDDLGVVLFERVGRRLKLTTDGEHLLAQSRRLLDDANLLTEHARSLKGGETGLLRIAATPHVIAGVIAPFVSRHMERFPGVEIQLLEGGAASQTTRLDRGEAHLAIMPVGERPVSGHLLYPVHALAVVRTDARLSKKRTLDVAALADQPLLLLRREFGSRSWLDAACASANFRPLVRLESGAPQTLVELAGAGYGVAVVPSTVSIPLKNVVVSPLLYQSQSLGRWSMIAWNPRRHLPIYAQRFVEGLLSFVRFNVPGRAHIRYAPEISKPLDPSL